MIQFISLMGLFTSLTAFASLPSHYDLREIPGAMNPVKAEGQCGSTWAFPAINAIEFQIFREEGTLVDLSEQFLISCDTQSDGCSGGENPLPFIQEKGVVLTSDFPYQGINATCKDVPIFRHINGWGWVNAAAPEETTSVDSIKQALLDYGPISSMISITPELHDYKAGIFTTCAQNPLANHMVSIVGWDDNGGYWVIRNMWGTQWGEAGYARIKYGCNNLGQEAAYVIYHK